MNLDGPSRHTSNPSEPEPRDGLRRVAVDIRLVPPAAGAAELEGKDGLVEAHGCWLLTMANLRQETDVGKMRLGRRDDGQGMAIHFANDAGHHTGLLSAAWQNRAESRL
ncbi:hypothetical protein E4U42_006071 [Claviceps africana]|uniref:Uncharacterized protein n=1 Tax=Claviceps africana TaxID=83212 RepID=A0A8K0NH00_9HYPO|nr:hypothetical protein E4U42_006071 [Claviceps africana]